MGSVTRELADAGGRAASARVDRFLSELGDLCEQHQMVITPRRGGRPHQLLVQPMNVLGMQAIKHASMMASLAEADTLPGWKERYRQSLQTMSQTELLAELTEQTNSMLRDERDTTRFRLESVRARLQETLDNVTETPVPRKSTEPPRRSPSFARAVAAMSEEDVAEDRRCLVVWQHKQTKQLRYFSGINPNVDTVVATDNQLLARHMTRATADNVARLYAVFGDPAYGHAQVVDTTKTNPWPKGSKLAERYASGGKKPAKKRKAAAKSARKSKRRVSRN